MSTIDDPRRKQRDIERAWREHDWRQGRIPFAVKPKLAAFQHGLLTSAVKIEQQIASPRRLFKPLLQYHGALQQKINLTMALPGAAVNVSKHGIDIRWLIARGPLIIDPQTYGEEQECIVTRLMLFWTERRDSTTALFG